MVVECMQQIRFGCIYRFIQNWKTPHCSGTALAERRFGDLRLEPSRIVGGGMDARSRVSAMALLIGSVESVRIWPFALGGRIFDQQLRASSAH